jgi:hypothetical protein
VSGASKGIKKPTERNAASKRTLQRKERSKRFKVGTMKKRDQGRKDKEEKLFLWNLAKGCLTKPQKDKLAARAGVPI